MGKEQNIRVRLLVFKRNQALLMYDSGVGFYYYPGGHVEYGETIQQAAERECLEECNDEFIFQKILYIRDYFDPKKGEHALELFVLGKLKSGRADNSKDPSGRETQNMEWVKLDDLPKKRIFPRTLSKKLIKDFKKGFPNQGEYVGVIE